MNKELTYKLVDFTEELISLLLLADESTEAINKYLPYCTLLVGYDRNNKPKAIMALYPKSNTQIEIKNIAVHTTLQSHGIGSYLLSYAKRYAVLNHFKTLLVGTGDVNYRQINFYTKNGFKTHSVRKNFFLDNYKKPIYDDGKQLVDMVVLEYKIR